MPSVELAINKKYFI